MHKIQFLGVNVSIIRNFPYEEGIYKIFLYDILYLTYDKN